MKNGFKIMKIEENKLMEEVIEYTVRKITKSIKYKKTSLNDIKNL